MIGLGRQMPQLDLDLDTSVQGNRVVMLPKPSTATWFTPPQPDSHHPQLDCYSSRQLH